MDRVSALRLLIVPSKVDGRVGAVLGIIHAKDDALLGHVHPRIGHARAAGGGAERSKVWHRRMRRRERLIALQHHIQQRLDMHQLVLKGDPDASRHGAGQLVRVAAVRLVIQLGEARAHPALVGGDFGHGRPLVGDLGVVVALLRVVDVRVDAALKDGPVAGRVSGGRPRHLGQLDVEKGRDVAQVEDAGVAELDGLLLELLVREHALCDNVPELPHGGPVLEGGEHAGVLRGEGAKRQICPLK